MSSSHKEIAYPKLQKTSHKHSITVFIRKDALPEPSYYLRKEPLSQRLRWCLFEPFLKGLRVLLDNKEVEEVNQGAGMLLQ